MSGSALSLLSWLVVGLFGSLGAALLVWAMFGDRARSRRRCGRCWYDMGGVEGLTCPECGRTAKAERWLRRTRRRWGLAALALVVLGVGSAPIAAPWVDRGGWVPWTPTWALRLAAPLLDEASDAYMGKVAARAPELNPWERLLVARFVQRELVREAEALRTTDAAVVALSKPQVSYVSKIGAEGRLFNREMAEVLAEFERLREAGRPTAGLGGWTFVCGWVGAAAAEHAPALGRIAEDAQVSRETRYRAVQALADMGSAATNQLLALLETPLDALSQRALLQAVGRLRLIETEELAAIFLKSTLHDDTEMVWLVIHALFDLLEEDAFGYDLHLVAAVRELAAAHPRADVRENATWQLQYGKAAPPGVYRRPIAQGMLCILTVPHPEAEAPDAGWGLVVVLPGGDGSDALQPIVTDLARQAMPPGYLVAQLVAPKGAEDADVIWPTADSLPEAAEFSAESFVRAAVEYLGERYPLNEQRIFGLGWGSGGEAMAAAAAAERSPLRGAMIAVNTFDPKRQSPPTPLHEKAFFLLPETGDAGSTSAAAAARDWLTAAGAHVRLDPGAPGRDCKGRLRDAAFRGIRWLEEQVGGE